MVIKDISEALNESVIDIRHLFYGTMIQSGISTFRLPKNHMDEVPRLLAKRVKDIDLSEHNNVSKALHAAALGKLGNDAYTQDQLSSINRLTSFLSEIYFAAKHKTPVVTAFSAPPLDSLEQIVREDFFLACRSLIGSLEPLSTELPLARTSIHADKVESFVEVLDSGLFDAYEESQHQLEIATNNTQSSLRDIKESAGRLADRFPATLDIKKASISTLQVVPSFLEALVGKAFGLAAKPFVDAIASLLAAERRLVIYSFEPTWRHVWESKLDKVRQLPRAGEA